MARLKKAPPPPTDTRNTLSEPEVAPAAQPKVDGRTLKKTGRILQFNTSVSDDFLKRFKDQAKRDRLKYAELLEAAFAAYEGLDKQRREELIESTYRS